MIIMLNLRGLYSIIKWSWLKFIRIDHGFINMIMSNRQTIWDLDMIAEHSADKRGVSVERMERIIRTSDAVPKKLSHMVDGLIVFILLNNQIGSGSHEDVSKVYTNSALIFGLQILLYLVSYQDNGALGFIMYGSKARVMDGNLGRENEIVGWICDKYMLPLTALLELALLSQTEQLNIQLISVYVFMPIIVGDSFAELVGSVWGKRQIRVCGVGERNTKSIEGTMAMFMSSLAVLPCGAVFHDASLGWYVLAVVVSGVSTFIELYAPRSTDNVFMVIGNLVCCIVYQRILEA